MRNTLIFFAVLIVTGLALKYARDNTSVVPDDMNETEFTTEAGTESHTTARAEAPKKRIEVPLQARPKSTPRILSLEEEQAWLVSLPTQEEVIADARSNPHGTPESLKNMVDIFASVMEEADRSPVELKKAFRKFELCAEDRDMSYVTSLKATCYLTAKRLAEKDQDLASDAEHLRDKLDSSTRRLVDSLEIL